MPFPQRNTQPDANVRSRAYIAASRRSDRSLEARIESARRASEIHKRRTGRSLRVTEADVVNEEMYEEEDDDLPMQYRRLTAHLQTQNADFDRRLAAYLTNHVAMRSALGQAVSDSWQNNQFNNIGQFMNQGSMQQQQHQQQQTNMQNPMLPPQNVNRSPTNYRQTPYPVSNAQGMRSQHGRSVSIATPQDPSFQKQHAQSVLHSPIEGVAPEDRRMSVPVSTMPQTPLSGSAAPTSSHSSPARGISRSASATNLSQQQQYRPQSRQQPSPPAQLDVGLQSSNPGFFSGLTAAQQNAINPLSTALPMESQQLLATNPFEFSLNDSMSMPQGAPAKHTYSYNPNGNPKSKANSPTNYSPMPQVNWGGPNTMGSMGGMNATLAPSALDMPNGFTESPADSAFSPAGLAGGFNNDLFSDLKEPVGGDSLSGTITPGEGDWAGFLSNDVWEEQPVA